MIEEKTKFWKCRSCRGILGTVHNNNNEIRCKTRNAFISVQGGLITCMCGFCTTSNTFIDIDYAKRNNIDTTNFPPSIVEDIDPRRQENKMQKQKQEKFNNKNWR